MCVVYSSDDDAISLTDLCLPSYQPERCYELLFSIV